MSKNDSLFEALEIATSAIQLAANLNEQYCKNHIYDGHIMFIAQVRAIIEKLSGEDKN